MLTRLFRYLCMTGVVAGWMGATAPSGETRLQGVLIDQMCSYKAETRVAAGPRLEGGIIVAYTHTRQCALMPACQKSGYGVFTYDGKFVPFDEAGNQKALTYFKQSHQEDDFRVEVAGQMQGDRFRVASIKPLP